jgi:xylulokinase
MQIVADVLQQPVQRLEGHPGSCLGAAWTAAIGAGLVTDWSGTSRFVTYGEVLQPDPANAELYRAGYRAYRALYRPGSE